MKKNSKNNNFIEYIISEESKGLRLDLAISNEYDQYSEALYRNGLRKRKFYLMVKSRRLKRFLI